MIGPLGTTGGRGGRDLTTVALRLLSEVARSPAFQARVRRLAGQAARRNRTSGSRPIEVHEVGAGKAGRATPASRSRRDGAMALRMRLRRLRTMVRTLDDAVGEQPEARRALDATSQALDGLKLHLRLATKLPTEKRQAELTAIATEAGRLEDGVLALLDELKTSAPPVPDAGEGNGT